MRCRHLNGELLEIAELGHYRPVVGGTLADEGANEEGNIVGYEYECHDCKRIWRYRTGGSIKLAWLKRLHEQL